MKENIEVILIVYFSIAGISAACTGLYTLTGGDLEDYESFWDWFIYNLLWIKQPLKYLFIHLTTWK